MNEIKTKGLTKIEKKTKQRIIFANLKQDTRTFKSANIMHGKLLQPPKKLVLQQNIKNKPIFEEKESLKE